MSEEILFEQRGFMGLVTLNRPKALNALNHAMVRALSDKLQVWAADESIRHVVLVGTGEKAFCAGGDIRAIYDKKQAGDTDLTAYFHDEYCLNYQISTYPKPYLSLIDGIVMGGGAGLSMHGTYRIGSEKVMFAMPETAIGFFPDVGSTHFLTAMPHRTGYYCGLTAARLNQADAYATGLLTHCVASADFPALLQELAGSDEVAATLAARSASPPPSDLMAEAAVLERLFADGDLPTIMARLSYVVDRGPDHPEAAFASRILKDMASKSPTSLHVVLQQLRQGEDLDLADCLKLEYRILSRIVMENDFFEGVRAVLVDKDHAPKWKPEKLAQVDMNHVASYFDPPRGGDLELKERVEA